MKGRIAVLSLLLAIAARPCQADEFQELLSGLNPSDLRSSIGSLETFVAKHPGHAQARFQLAKSYMSFNQNSLAEDQLRACMEIAAVGSDLHNNCISALKEISQSKSGKIVSSTEKRQGVAPGASAIYQESGRLSSSKSTVQQYGTLKNSALNALPKPDQKKASGKDKSLEPKAN